MVQHPIIIHILAYHASIKLIVQKVLLLQYIPDIYRYINKSKYSKFKRMSTYFNSLPFSKSHDGYSILDSTITFLTFLLFIGSDSRLTAEIVCNVIGGGSDPNLAG